MLTLRERERERTFCMSIDQTNLSHLGTNFRSILRLPPYSIPDGDYMLATW